jgi:hypothetical protein
MTPRSAAITARSSSSGKSTFGTARLVQCYQDLMRITVNPRCIRSLFVHILPWRPNHPRPTPVAVRVVRRPQRVTSRLNLGPQRAMPGPNELRACGAGRGQSGCKWGSRASKTANARLPKRRDGSEPSLIALGMGTASREFAGIGRPMPSLRNSPSLH